MTTAAWWTFVVRGIAAVVFGILTWIWPGMALLTLVLLFGAYAIVGGALTIAGAFRRTAARPHPRWVLLLEGIVSVLAGIIAFIVPGFTALSLLYLIGIWSLVTGVLQIATAVHLRRQIKGEWLMALSGILSIVFGVVLLIFPGAGALAVLVWIGAYAVVFGAMLIALGVRVRTRSRARGPGTGFGEFAPSGGH